MRNIKSFTQFLNEGNMYEGKWSDTGLETMSWPDEELENFFSMLAKRWKCKRSDIVQVGGDDDYEDWMEDTDFDNAADYVKSEWWPENANVVERYWFGGPGPTDMKKFRAKYGFDEPAIVELQISDRPQMVHFGDYGFDAYAYNKKKTKF